MISDTLELLRPKIKLCSSLEEAIRQVQDLEREFLIKLGKRMSIRDCICVFLRLLLSQWRWVSIVVLIIWCFYCPDSSSTLFVFLSFPLRSYSLCNSYTMEYLKTENHKTTQVYMIILPNTKSREFLHTVTVACWLVSTDKGRFSHSGRLVACICCSFPSLDLTKTAVVKVSISVRLQWKGDVLLSKCCQVL